LTVAGAGQGPCHAHCPEPCPEPSPSISMLPFDPALVCFVCTYRARIDLTCPSLTWPALISIPTVFSDALALAFHHAGPLLWYDSIPRSSPI
jgi:hypothetical protein